MTVLIKTREQFLATGWREEGGALVTDLHTLTFVRSMRHLFGRRIEVRNYGDVFSNNEGWLICNEMIAGKSHIAKEFL